MDLAQYIVIFCGRSHFLLDKLKLIFYNKGREDFDWWGKNQNFPSTCCNPVNYNSWFIKEGCFKDGFFT